MKLDHTLVHLSPLVNAYKGRDFSLPLFLLCKSKGNLTNLTKDALLRAHRASGVVTFSTTDYSDFTDFCKSLRSCEAAEPNALSTIIQQPSTFYSHANLATFRSLAEGESKSHEGCIATRASASGMVTFSTTDDTDFTDCCKSLRSC